MGVINLDKRDKVIKGLECCAAYEYKCNDCPYQDDGGTEDDCYSDELYADALALLKAQEPRVMMLEEVCKGLVWLDTYRTSEVEPVYILEMNKRGEIYYLVFGTGARPMLYDEDYNKEYRFWTSRPTDAQRKAVEWDD